MGGMHYTNKEDEKEVKCDVDNIGTNFLVTPPTRVVGLTKRITRSEEFIDQYFFDLLSQASPNGSEKLIADMIRKYLPLSIPLETDEFGNVWTVIGPKSPKTMFSAHMDTVHPKPIHIHLNKTIIPGEPTKCDFLFATRDGVKKDKDEDHRAEYVCNLGGDDKVGVYILSHLIKAGVEGLYMFHVGEERGCIGSNAVKNKLLKTEERFKELKRAIAFDRKGYGDVINNQGGDCCSDDFGKALSKALNDRLEAIATGKMDPKYKYSPTRGVWTDTAVYKETIPECTNLSCGYFLQHGPTEHCDPLWLEHFFIPAAKGLDWEALPTARDPHSVVAYSHYGTGHDTSNWRSGGVHGQYTFENFPYDKCVAYSEIDVSTGYVDVPVLPPTMEAFLTDMPQSPEAMKRIMDRSNGCLKGYLTYNDAPRLVFEALQLAQQYRKLSYGLVNRLVSDQKVGLCKLPEWFTKEALMLQSTQQDIPDGECADEDDADMSIEDYDKLAKPLGIHGKFLPSAFDKFQDNVWSRLAAMEDDVDACHELLFLDKAQRDGLLDHVNRAWVGVDALTTLFDNELPVLLQNKRYDVQSLANLRAGIEKEIGKVGEALYSPNGVIGNDRERRSTISNYIKFKKEEARAKSQAQKTAKEEVEKALEAEKLVEEAKALTTPLPDPQQQGAPKPTCTAVVVADTQGRQLLVTSSQLEGKLKQMAAGIDVKTSFEHLNIQAAFGNFFKHLEKGRRFVLNGSQFIMGDGDPQKSKIVRKGLLEQRSAIELFERAILPRKHVLTSEMELALEEYDFLYLTPLKTYLKEEYKNAVLN